jgi:hypothetical protein
MLDRKRRQQKNRGSLHLLPQGAARFRFPSVGIFKLQGIDSANPLQPGGPFYNPIPSRFLATIDCSKIPALDYTRKIQQV